MRIANDQESLEMALVENIQRQDLDPIEIALSYQRLIEEIDLTQEQMSDRVGKSRSAITNYLRLLKLDPIIQTGMRDGFISMGHGRALIAVDSLDKQLDIYQQILANGLSVRDTEAIVKAEKGVDTLPRKQAKNTKLPSEIVDATKELSDTLGAKVNATVDAKGKGKLTIAFKSQKELERIIKQLNA